MSDRYAAMQAPGPCPTCGTSAGRPTYRPDHTKPIENQEMYIEWAERRGPNSE